MGLRDRLRGILGRERPSVAPPLTVAPPAGPAPTAVPAPRPVAAAGLAGARIVDVRDADRFAAGHLPGAERVALADLRGLADETRLLVFVCDDGEASAGAAERLVALGARAGWLDGGMAGWTGPREAA